MGVNVIEELRSSIEGKNRVIVFPEGEDVRVVTAVAKLQKEGIIKPILLGKKEDIEKAAKEANVDLEGVEQIDPQTSQDYEKFVSEFVTLRKGKATEEQARETIKDPNYFGTMMVQLGKADGMVSGAIHSTGDTVRPALQIIKTKPGVSRISGAMVMLGPEGQRYHMADIAINITLEAEALAEIAIVSGETAKMFGIDPKVAMLSFSTNGSAHSPETEKMALATKLAKELASKNNVDFPIDGELQFDAAIAPEVGKLKFPGSTVAGEANVFIFPSLEAGNIGYKIGQRLGGYEAIGPILQGLNKPVNDLSRGCNAEEVYKLAIVTAAQV